MASTHSRLPLDSIVGGPDSALFVINPATGALSFASPHNFEAPTDDGLDNVYNVVVQASDGVSFERSDHVTFRDSRGLSFRVRSAPTATVPAG